MQVTLSADGGSGLQLVLGAGRGARGGLPDFPQLVAGRLEPFHRVVLVLSLSGRPAARPS
ncbi:hypothetical protein ACFSL4_19070 [Streptomyces caeni]|uniref:MobA-like NTP transferase domain-containing protein n=1 Tax=Streptomyces caeni TaxID=2307231 RepID=A0ABW4IS97_9ACTN